MIFELGLSMALGKTIIPTYYEKYDSENNKLSFDYEHFDTIFFKDYEELKNKLMSSLLPLKKFYY